MLDPRFTLVPFDLPPNSPVLLVGAGGGYDVLCGLSIALDLGARGHPMQLANYSFTRLQQVDGGTWHSEHLLEVGADATLPGSDYFPEGHLARWYRERMGTEQTVWCLARGGVVPTLESYDFLVKRFGIEVVICVDGGVDGLFRGDEHDLGTPSMDSVSVIATSLCSAPTRLYACTAFGTEGAESEVSHAQALHRLADLVRENGLLGTGILLPRTDAGQEFASAVDYLSRQVPPLQRSIILSTLVSALQGGYGYTVVHEKTRERPPWISPLTLLVWYCDAVRVARMKLFYEDASKSETVQEVNAAIERIRERTSIAPYESIPI